MINEMTVQVRVSDFSKGVEWYKTLLKKDPDFIPHKGFAEWELLPKCWLQVSVGIPSEGNGPIRFGVTNIEYEKERILGELHVENFELHSREGVPVKWGTFTDPWGNHIGIFESLSS
ncbi:VOC family protein [Bacillus manliponensis]|uniref:VOC family protein n=1 Tax=Bacillus manliponensis TaxID=574376 RepID=UPI0005521967|nr:ornithine monooxygenase [Bacillus manliponensis]